MAWWAAAAAAAANFMSQQGANQTNRDLAYENREWQEYMSGTAHQREVEDLKKAGLNPVLSAGGNGASTPSASPAQVQAPQVNFPEIYNAYSGMKQLELADRDMQLKESANAVGMAKTVSDTELNRAKKILAQKGLMRAELEGEASQLMRNFLRMFKTKVNKVPKAAEEVEQLNTDRFGMP